MGGVMKTASNESLYRLILENMRILGASRTTLVALDAYVDAVRRLNCRQDAFTPALHALNAVIRGTEPKLTPLVHLIDEFEAEMLPFQAGSLEALKKEAIRLLEQKHERFEAATGRVTEQCMDRIATNDFIIAHAPTGYLRNAFVRAFKELKQRFDVLILKNDFYRTKELINALEAHRVPYLVIPEYNLSHFLDRTNKLFIAAVSVTSDGRAVTGIGTANVVGLCRWHRVPVYLFAERLKFTHLPLPEQRIHVAQEDRLESGFTFRMTTFSHDIISLGMIDHLVTEDGETNIKT
jgi:translation initiation factor eIF-2B subunit alpha